MKRLALVLVLALAMTMALVGSSFAADQSITVNLATQNNSGISGTATLTAQGNQTQVVINVTGEAAGASMPDHIHTGTCATLGGVKYPLANVVNGTSTTTVNVSLATLESATYAINLHKSAQEINVYTACGDIKGTNQAATTTTTQAAATTATQPTAAPSTGAGGLATGGRTALPLAAVLVVGLLLAVWAVRPREA